MPRESGDSAGSQRHEAQFARRRALDAAEAHLLMPCCSTSVAGIERHEVAEHCAAETKNTLLLPSATPTLIAELELQDLIISSSQSTRRTAKLAGAGSVLTSRINKQKKSLS